MTDLDLLVIGALVTFLAFAGAYIAIRHRANEEPVDSYAPSPRPQASEPAQPSRIVPARDQSNSHAN